MLFGGGCSVESCSGGFRNSAEKGISRGANCQVLLRWYSELRREENFPGSKLSGFCSGGIRNTQSTTCIPLWFRAFSCSHGQGCNTAYILKIRQILLPVFYFPQSKIEYRRSKNCSAGNPPPRGNPGLKCTRMDAILK
jgi:hypothetical protein